MVHSDSSVVFLIYCQISNGYLLVSEIFGPVAVLQESPITAFPKCLKYGNLKSKPSSSSNMINH